MCILFIELLIIVENHNFFLHISRRTIQNHKFRVKFHSIPLSHYNCTENHNTKERIFQFEIRKHAKVYNFIFVLKILVFSFLHLSKCRYMCFGVFFSFDSTLFSTPSVILSVHYQKKRRIQRGEYFCNYI